MLLYSFFWNNYPYVNLSAECRYSCPLWLLLDFQHHVIKRSHQGNYVCGIVKEKDITLRCLRAKFVLDRLHVEDSWTEIRDEPPRELQNGFNKCAQQIIHLFSSWAKHNIYLVEGLVGPVGRVSSVISFKTKKSNFARLFCFGIRLKKLV